MKRLCFLLLSSMAFGQGVILPPQQVLKVVNGITSPVPNATITVCAANVGGIPCAPALVNALFKDAALTQSLSNPFTSDANGNYSFAMASGTFTVTVSAATFVGYSYQITVPLAAGANLSFTGTTTFSGPANLNGGGSLIGTFSGPTTFSGNNTFTGAPMITGSNAGAWTNNSGSAMNEYVQSLLNGCSPLTEMQSIFGTSLSTMTEGVTGCDVIPASATVFQGNAVSGWTEGKSNTTKSVGVSGWAQSTAVTPTGVFGGNFGATDCGSSSNANCNSAVANANMFGVEIDCNLNKAASQCHNILVGSSFAIQPTTSFGIQFGAPVQAGACTVCTLPFGIYFNTNVTGPPSSTSAAIFLNQSQGGGGDTQAIWFQGGAGNGWLDMKNNGDLQFASNSGGGVLDLLNSGIKFEETTAPTAGAAKDVCYGDSAAHTLKCNYNNATPAAATFANVPLVIASGTATMTTAAITAPACGTTVTVAAANVATTDTITWAFNAAPAGTNAGIVAWPTSGNVNFAYCPGVTETPAAATINWRVVR